MLPQQPNVAGLGDRINRRFRDFVRVGVTFGLFGQQLRELLIREPGQHQVEVEALQIAEFNGQQFEVPAGVQRQLVIGDDICLLLGLAPALGDHGRDLGQAQLAGSRQTSVPREKSTVLINEDRVGPAPLADRGCDLRDLFVRVRAGVARIGRDLLYRPELAALGRPVLIHRCP